MTTPDVSVAVLADDASPVFLYATVKSATRAICRLQNSGYSAELIVLSKNPSGLETEFGSLEPETRVVQVPPTMTEDRGAGRRMLAEVCAGRYIAPIEAGDMWSADWLCAALEFLELKKPSLSVARPEIVVGVGLDFYSNDGLFVTFQTNMTERRDGAALFMEMPYAPTYLVHREVIATIPFPKPDFERGWRDLDAWWTANALGAGHAQCIVSGTFLYRWNKGDGRPRRTHIGPTGLDAAFGSATKSEK